MTQQLTQLGQKVILEAIEAMEKGDYKKGKYHLRCKNNQGYCALGVIADILVDRGIGHWEYLPVDTDCEETDRTYLYYYIDQNGHRWHNILPHNIQKLIFTAYSTVWIDKIYEANDNADNFHPAIDVLKGLL